VAGGQQITSGQGSVTQGVSVALVGLAIASATGTLVYSEGDALTGAESTFAAGDVGSNRLIVLRSRKVGGGAASRTLSGQAVSVSQGAASPNVVKALTGLSIATAQGSLGKTRSKALTGSAVTASTGTVVSSGSGLTWTGDIFPMTIQRGSFFDLAPFISDPAGELANITANVSLPSGVVIASSPTWRITASSGATLGNTSAVNLTLVKNSAADFLNRISGADVVWWHNFDSASEVNQFRWTGGFGSGQDPNAAGSGGNLVSWQSSGGADGGAFLRIAYPAGSSQGQGNSYFWRPFNPLTGATNGKGAADPGANGTISPATFTVTSGSGTTNGWTGSQSNPGWYMHPTHQSANPGKFQGHDFWLQIRVRRASTPGAPPDNLPSYTNITGKHVWFSNTNYTYVVQELVGYGYSVGNGDAVGVQSRFNVYSGQNFTSLFDGQPNATVTTSNLSMNWRYSGGWDTLLYHVTPGTNGGTGANRTRVEVWAQHDPALVPSEAGVYTKICDVTYTQSYDTNGTAPLPGWNALILAAYHNGSSFSTSWQFDYDQVIFSKASIPAPQV
jgi:hypothetical protein